MSRINELLKNLSRPLWTIEKKAQRCPLCMGEGEVSKKLSEIQEDAHKFDRPMSDVKKTKPCHGCHGRGWITI